METKQISDIRPPLKLEELDSLWMDIGRRVRADEASESRRLANFQDNWYKYEKIRKLLMFANYDSREFSDGAIKLYGRFFSGCYLTYLLTRRPSKTRFILGMLPLLYWEVVAVSHFSFRNGLNRKAVFGDDRLAQECRLFLVYFFPDSPHRDLLWSRIREFQQKQH
jgi:hypothetical protein